jgi:hypothetical protein
MANKSSGTFFSYQGNANQMHIEIPSHPSQDYYNQENKDQQMLVRMHVCGSRKSSVYT